MATLKIVNGREKYYNIDARANAVSYILDPFKARTFSGGYKVDKYNIAGSMDEVAARFGKTSGVQLRHLIVSFAPEDRVTLEKANRIGQVAASFFAKEYQAIYAVHEDTDTLHIHIVVNSISYIDGHRYGGTKKEFYSFMHYMKEVLRCYFNVYSFRYVS